MSQKDKKKNPMGFSGSSNGGGGGGYGGYGSPKHGNNNSGGGGGGGGRNNNNNNNKSPHQSHHSHHNSGGNQQHQQQQPQQPYDSLTAMKDRTLYMSMSLVGQIVSVTLKNGDIYEGILTATTASSTTTTSTSTTGGLGISLRMARKKDLLNKVITTQPIPLIIIESKDFLQLTATGVLLENYRDSFMKDLQQSTISSSSSQFITDTELSGFDGNLKERELTPWTPDPLSGESLDDFASSMDGSNNKKPTNWDQFETNEKLFGVRTTYEEEIYTTALDRNSEFYKSNQSAAERKAQEIENEKSGGLHSLEERGFIGEGADDDEEERYSSVVRKVVTPVSSGSGSVYLPPSKRTGNTPPTNTTTTTAAAAIRQQQAQAAAAAQVQQKQQQQASVTSPTTTTSTATTTNESPISSSGSSNSSTPSSAPSTPKTNVVIAGGIGNSPLGDKESSPGISKLRLQHQSTIDQDVMGSPRENLSPRSVAYTRYRQILSEPANKLKTSGSGISNSTSGGSGGGVNGSGVNLSGSNSNLATSSGSVNNGGVGPNGTPLLSSHHHDNQAPKSPVPTIVSNHGLVKALSLELATPTVPEKVVNDFNNFKLKLNNVDRGSETQGLKSFSNNLVIKSKSRPGSPLIGSGSPRPTPTQLSLSQTSTTTTIVNTTNNSNTTTTTTTEEQATVVADSTNNTITAASVIIASIESIKSQEEKEKDKETTDSSTTTTTTDKKDQDTTTSATTAVPATTATTTSTPLKPLSKLKLNPNAKEFVYKPAAPTTSTTTVSAPVKSTFIESNTDSNVSINEIYYESMRKKQLNPESPENVSLFWVIDPQMPYIRYEEDPYSYQMRGVAHHMGHPQPIIGGHPGYGQQFYQPIPQHHHQGPQHHHQGPPQHHHQAPPPHMNIVGPPPGVNIQPHHPQQPGPPQSQGGNPMKPPMNSSGKPIYANNPQMRGPPPQFMVAPPPGVVLNSPTHQPPQFVYAQGGPPYQPQPQQPPYNPQQQGKRQQQQYYPNQPPYNPQGGPPPSTDIPSGHRLNPNQPPFQPYMPQHVQQPRGFHPPPNQQQQPPQSNDQQYH